MAKIIKKLLVGAIIAAALYIMGYVAYIFIYRAFAYFGANWTVIPAESGHRIRVKLDTNSGGNWTPIPV